MKKRKPWLIFLLSIVTLSVYWFIWQFKFQNELREESGKGILPVGHIMMLLFPGVNIIYYIVWLSTVEGRLVLAGAPGKNRWWMHILLFVSVVGNLFIATILQNKANKIGEVDQTVKSSVDLRTDKYAKYQQK